MLVRGGNIEIFLLKHIYKEFCKKIKKLTNIFPPSKSTV